MKLEQGAALTETAILMLVLMPIMFGIPMIGKLIDLRQTTAQASRYGAWEATVNTGEAAPNTVKARFYSNAAEPLGGDDTKINDLWGGNRNGANPTFEQDDSVRSVDKFWNLKETQVRLIESTGQAGPYVSAYDHGADGAIALNLQDVMESAGQISAIATGGKWMDSGDRKGMLRSEVEARVSANGWFDELVSTDASVIMYDNWSSGNDDQAKKRSRTMVPAGALEEPIDVFAKAGNFILFKELKQLDGVFGRVDMDPLPLREKRRRVLKPYTEE